MNVKPKLKTERIELRLTPKQKDHLRDLALLDGVSITQLIITSLKLPATTQL